MPWSRRLKHPGRWAIRSGLLALAILTFAGGGQGAFAAAQGQVQRDSVVKGDDTTQLATSQRLLQEAARNDLRALRSDLTFKPFLPLSLALPEGYLYNRVTWGAAPADGFGIFISGPLDSAGSHAIHVDEALEYPSELRNASFPLNAFKQLLKPVRLSNGVWFEMQQQHAPWRGEWILMRLVGNIAIEIDGLGSKLLLTQFAGSLLQST